LPGSSPTMARRDPVRWLNSVDLPTLGRPTMATRGDGFFLLKAFSCSDVFFLRGGDELRCPSRYYRDSGAFLIPSRISSRDWACGILPAPVLRAWGPALENASCVRVSPRAAADGASGRRGPRRKAPLDRGSRHGHRQDAGLSAARDPLGQTGHHLNRYEEPAGAALLQRCSGAGAGTVP